MLKLCVSISEMYRKYLANDERGVTLIEYALIAAVIAVGVIVGGQLTGVSTALNNTFQAIADQLATVPGP